MADGVATDKVGVAVGVLLALTIMLKVEVVAPSVSIS
jgi:hypothetical protein